MELNQETEVAPAAGATGSALDGSRHVVVAGAGFAGLGAAFTLRRRLRPTDRVTVVEPSGQFLFAPSLIYAVLGKPLVHSSFALEPALRSKGIEFVRSHVREVDLEQKRVTTDDGRLDYDRLVIATGGRPDPEAVPGLAGEFRANSYIVGLDTAEDAQRLLRGLLDEPGPIVIGVSQEASYISGLYELTLALDTALKKARIRSRAPITFVTAEPYLGHLGFGQTAAREKMEAIFGERDIPFLVDAPIERVRREEVVLKSGESLPAKISFVMPPFTGDVDIWKSTGLTDELGMVPVDDRYRHVAHQDVYAAGVASIFTHPMPPLQERRAPHTGYLSMRMGKRAGDNVTASLGCGSPATRTLPETVDVRILDGGETGLLLSSRGKSSLTHHAVRLPGSASHGLKSAVERYLLWQLRTGRVDLP